MGLDNPLHIAFLVVILLLVFGARRLPEIGRSLGGGMREFKDAVTGSSQQPSQQPQQPGLNAAQQQPHQNPFRDHASPFAIAGIPRLLPMRAPMGCANGCGRH